MIIPTFIIRPNSVVVATTDGFNPRIGANQLADYRGTVYDDSTMTNFITVVNAAGVAVLPQTQMDYVSPGVWQYRLDAGILVAGGGPWKITYDSYDNLGTSGEHLNQFVAIAKEEQ